MGAKYCFFTDPSLLGTQAPDQAFGPLTSTNSFLVTDLHAATAGAPVVAVCKGLVCAQVCSGNDLSLILKPTDQPPFPFPYISYFIYKGVARDSLLDANGALLTTGDNELLDACLASWANSGNDNGNAVADKRCLGLHLTADAGPIDEPDKYADDASIDRLFYDADADFPPVEVKMGDRMGVFGGLIGLQIVVERLGRQPKIGWTRSVRHEVPGGALSGTPAPNTVASFGYWHDREAILDFVDPCAFWGSFLLSRLAKSKAASAIDGADIYATVLRGGFDDNPDGAYVNRNLAYFDIRNEHGQSLNYYKTPSIGPNFQLVIGGGEIDSGVVDYYRSGWPCFRLDSSALSALPANPTLSQIGIQFALPKTDYSSPLIYVSVGYATGRAGKGVRLLKEQERFMDRPKRAQSPYLEPCVVAAPLVKVGAQHRFVASYQKISHFKRYEKPATVSQQDPADLTPVAAGMLDYVLPVPGAGMFPRNVGAALVKTYADHVFVRWPSDDSDGFVARPGFARDGANVYLFLLPTARLLFQATQDNPLKSGPPVFEDLNHFLPDYLKSGARALGWTTLNPPPPGTTVQALHESYPGAVRDRADPQSDLIVLAVKRTDYEASVAAAAQTETLTGSGVLSLSLSGKQLDANGWLYRKAVVGYSCLSAPLQPPPGAVVSRSAGASLPALYAHAGL